MHVCATALDTSRIVLGIYTLGAYFLGQRILDIESCTLGRRGDDITYASLAIGIYFLEQRILDLEPCVLRGLVVIYALGV